MFTIERYFKDNERYNNYFGIEGNALVDALSIFWTDKVYFEKKLETLSDIFPELEDTLQSEDEPIILEIDYNLRRQKVTIPDYMNCLKTFINAAGSKHPKETLNDYILKIEPQFQNAQNKIDYCHIDGKDAVSFVKMRQEFVETILFGGYFYWDCEYEIRINDTNRDTYKQYANYYLDELAQFSGLPRENVREHDLFKVYDEMKRNFIKSFINTLNASTANTEVQLSAEQKSNLNTIEPTPPYQKAFQEITTSNYVKPDGKIEKLIQYKYEWYYVMRASVELGIVTGVNSFTEFIALLPDNINKELSVQNLSTESAKFGNENNTLLSEPTTCSKLNSMKQERFDKGLKIAKVFCQSYKNQLKTRKSPC